MLSHARAAPDTEYQGSRQRIGTPGWPQQARGRGVVLVEDAEFGGDSFLVATTGFGE